MGPFGYLVLTEAELGFGLDGPRGDDLWLIEADASGRPLRFSNHVGFGAAAPDVSVGPGPTAAGDWIAPAAPTWGRPNSGHRVGDIVISEVHYQPRDPDRTGRLKAEHFEFMELYNGAERETDVSGWRLAGAAEFTFGPGTTIGPGDTALVVRFDPGDEVQANIFRFMLGADLDVVLWGSFAPTLADAGGTIQLILPGQGLPNDPAFVAWYPVDECGTSRPARGPWKRRVEDSRSVALSRAISVCCPSAGRPPPLRRVAPSSWKD